MTALCVRFAVMRRIVMMSDRIQIFEHKRFGSIRTVVINNEPWFVGTDVAGVLGYKNTSRDIRRHVDKEDIQNYRNGSFKMSNRGMTIVNESGLYALIFGSEKPEAKAFKHWVTSEILPTIRKHGFYASDDVIESFLNDPDMAIDAFSKLKAEKEKIIRLEAENRQLADKCRYLDLILSCDNVIPITVIAKDYGMTGNEMNSELKALGIQYKLPSGTWVLMDRYANMGYTRSNTFVYDKRKGRCSVHTVWTQLGRKFIYEKLKSTGILPLCERRIHRGN